MERSSSCAHARGWALARAMVWASGLLVVLAVAAGTIHGQNSAVRLPPETGDPAVRNFSPKEYGAGQQNFAVVQDSRGVVYIGNGDGLLEFDGARWRLIQTPRRSAVRALAIDASGRVFVGAQGEIGYLAPDETGAARFVSLEDRIPEGSRDFEDVWRAFATPDGVYFSTYAALFLVHGDLRIQVWKPETSFRLAFLARGRIFIREVDRGLVELRGDTVVPVAGSERLGDAKIYAMDDWTNGRILVTTAGEGLFVLDGDSIQPLETGADDIVRAALVFQSLWLSDGRLALATLNAGVLLFDSSGRYLGSLTKESGLRDQNVKALFQDEQGGLWLALNDGLSRVEIGSPLTAFGERSGLSGAVICERWHDGALYVGTTDGLFRLVALDGGAHAFAAVPGVESETWDLMPYGDSLLVANAQGVYQVRGTAATLVRPSGVYASALAVSKRDPARVWVGLQAGLASMRFEGGRWIDEGRIPKLRGEVRSLYETRDGRLWAGTPTEGSLRLTLPDGWKGGASEPSPRIEEFGTADGLPTPKHVRVYDLDGDPIFATQRGVYRFDATANRFEPDPRFAGLFPDRPRWVMALREDAERRIWMHAVDEEHGSRWTGAAVPQSDGTYRWQPAPPMPISATDSDLSAAVDPAGVVWYGSPADGLFRYDPAVPVTTGWPNPVLVRRVLTDADHPLAAGSPTLEYANNSLRFEFAAPSFDGLDANRYQVLLDGNDRDWSPWSTEAYKEYTNLSEGTYRFRVRARNRYGEVSPEAVYAFRVLPPWYRTWWAYLFYLALAAAAVSAFARIRTRALTRRTVELEGRIAERTAELAQSREEALEANRAKSVFLANMSHELRTPLNAVIGFAQLMRRNRQLPPSEREHLDIIAQSGEHLLGLINDVLSISKIEAGRLTLDAKPFDLRRMLEAVEAMIRVRSEAKGIGLEVEITPDLPLTVTGDEGKLRQVLLNLLGNAVKFTNDGGIRLRASWSDGRARFQVADTGAGIAATEIGSLFEPFVQTEAGREAKEGTGLGLVISRQIVRLMGGDISVESEIGRGTTFTFDVELPFADGAVAVTRERRVTGLASDTTPPRILVVDDTREGRVLLAKLLEQIGFEVRQAANGAEAVETWRAWRPDLVFMDLRMPVLDGREATRRIREEEGGGAHTPVIALTASAFEHERDEILAGGADGFLPKPFREQAIFDAIAEHLGVSYVYEDQAPAAAREDSAALLTPRRFASVPAEEVVALRRALEVGNVREAQTVAERIEAHDADLGHAIAAELRQYNIDEVLEVLERLEPAP